MITELIIGFIGFMGIVVGIIGKYFYEKAKNMAKKQDIKQITDNIEKTKNKHVRHSNAWNFIFENEYKELQNLWKVIWSFQSSVRQIRPNTIDFVPEDKEERKKMYIKRHKESFKEFKVFIESFYKKRPFIPLLIYEKSIEIHKIVKELETDFIMSMKKQEGDNNYNWPNWQNIIQCNKKLDEKLDELNLLIKEHIHIKLN